MMESLSELENFHFMFDKKLAGCASPPKQALALMKAEGFSAVVSLQSGQGSYDVMDYTEKDLQEAGLDFLHIPVDDFYPPTPEQFDEFVEFVDSQDGAVMAHCYLGMGRTGTMGAAYVGRKNGWDAAKTLTYLRGIWRRYVQTVQQEQALIYYLG